MSLQLFAVSREVENQSRQCKTSTIQLWHAMFIVDQTVVYILMLVNEGGGDCTSALAWSLHICRADNHTVDPT